MQYFDVDKHRDILPPSEWSGNLRFDAAVGVIGVNDQDSLFVSQNEDDAAIFNFQRVPSAGFGDKRARMMIRVKTPTRWMAVCAAGNEVITRDETYDEAGSSAIFILAFYPAPDGRILIQEDSSYARVFTATESGVIVAHVPDPQHPSADQLIVPGNDIPTEHYNAATFLMPKSIGRTLGGTHQSGMKYQAPMRTHVFLPVPTSDEDAVVRETFALPAPKMFGEGVTIKQAKRAGMYRK